MQAHSALLRWIQLLHLLCCYSTASSCQIVCVCVNVCCVCCVLLHYPWAISLTFGRTGKQTHIQKQQSYSVGYYKLWMSNPAVPCSLFPSKISPPSPRAVTRTGKLYCGHTPPYWATMSYAGNFLPWCLPHFTIIWVASLFITCSCLWPTPMMLVYADLSPASIANLNIYLRTTMDWEKGLEKEEEEDRDEERSEWLKDDVSLVGAYRESVRHLGVA